MPRIHLAEVLKDQKIVKIVKWAVPDICSTSNQHGHANGQAMWFVSRPWERAIIPLSSSPPEKKYYESMNHRNIDKHLCHQRILSDQFKLFLGSYLIISNVQYFKVKIKWGRLKNEISVTSLSRLRSLNMLCLAACIANDKHSGFEGRRLFGGQYIYKNTHI